MHGSIHHGSMNLGFEGLSGEAEISPPIRPAASVARRRLQRAIALLLVLAFVMAPGAAFAQKYTAARKAGRGGAGVVLGILEIPGNMVKETRANGAARGFTLGFAMGLGMLVVRELVGVYELLTCPFEIPSGFKPIIEPEFPWDYFEED